MVVAAAAAAEEVSVPVAGALADVGGSLVPKVAAVAVIAAENSASRVAEFVREGELSRPASSAFPIGRRHLTVEVAVLIAAEAAAAAAAAADPLTLASGPPRLLLAVVDDLLQPSAEFPSQHLFEEVVASAVLLLACYRRLRPPPRVEVPVCCAVVVSLAFRHR